MFIDGGEGGIFMKKRFLKGMVCILAVNIIILADKPVTFSKTKSSIKISSTSISLKKGKNKNITIEALGEYKLKNIKIKKVANKKIASVVVKNHTISVKGKNDGTTKVVLKVLYEDSNVIKSKKFKIRVNVKSNVSKATSVNSTENADLSSSEGISTNIPVVAESIEYGETFYATITEINGSHICVKGYDINDVNHRTKFSFNITEQMILSWRGIEISAESLKVGQNVAITYTGAVSASFPMQISNVVKLVVLDDNDVLTTESNNVNVNLDVYGQAFYASVTEINGSHVCVKGMDINDINHRGVFTFNVTEQMQISWLGVSKSLCDLKVGQNIVVTYIGAVSASFPSQISNPVKIVMLDDAV